MGVAENQVEDVTLEDGLEADAFDLEILLIAGGNALDHVADDGAGGAMKGTGRAVLGSGGDNDLVAGLRETHAAEVAREFALGALDADGRPVDGHLDPGGDGDG